MINFINVISRIKAHKGFLNDYEVADLFGISAPDLSQRKHKGTILNKIVEWGINENINLNWLLIGHGEPYIEKNSQVKEHKTEILRMSEEILLSNNVYSESLAANIRSFYHAIKIENRLDNLELKNSKKNMEIRKGDSSEKKQEILKKRVI